MPYIDNKLSSSVVETRRNFKYSLNKKVFNLITDAVRTCGFDSYIIGGFVRDCLLQRTCKDIDVVVIGDSLKVAREFAKFIKRPDSLQVYKNFGTAMIKYRNWNIEFIMARSESYPDVNSRNPKVNPSTFSADIKRRDFTINTLSISLNESNYGELIDVFDGIIDIKNRVLKTPLESSKTFSDDPLRMMRCIRFATQLEFDIEPITYEGIKKNKHRLGIVCQERITDELSKIILSRTPSIGFRLLSDTGILNLVIPELVALQGIDIIDNKSHKDNFHHTLQVLDNAAKKSSNVWLRWAALFHDIAKPLTKRFDPGIGWSFHGHEEKGTRVAYRIFKRLKLPLSKELKYVQKLIRFHMRPIVLSEEGITDSAVRRLVFALGDDIDDLMLLCRADITSKNKIKVQQYLNNLQKVDQKIVDIEQRDSIRNFKPAIDGNIIMKTFDLEPSKIVGSIRNSIRDAILDGVIKNEYEEIYNFMIQKAKDDFNITPVDVISKSNS